ncbi:DEAD/DEAH box helicase family protein [Aliiruegeria lutimaris]|uniref:Restriction endonuclease n=1 Tax=Aliiruegeria lutimaris TaxID=571298 RepID=A0A1G8UYY1_9RHOB|nr:DEAD/DEAH box helicase family protein [Aliiruegeria lutimaris]SDJ58797.1 Restriction endonuclease [Aliiruegeria lutimaris]
MPGFVSVERLAYGPWQAFERMIARLAKHAGFEDVALVGGSGDHGADVVGVMEGQRWVFQAKYRTHGSVDEAGAREAAWALGKYDAVTAVAATNQEFYPGAYDFIKAQENAGIDLRAWNGNHLLQFYDQLPSVSMERREPRDYQHEAINTVEAKRGRGDSRALVLMATGLGKSMVANQLVAQEFARNPRQEVLVMAHMSDLVKQLEVSSWAQLPKDCSTHVWTDGERPAYPGGVVFATWQSVSSAIARGDDLAGRFGLVIVDEAHHAPSESFSSLIARLEPNFLVGLTATPWRGDNRDITELFGDPAFSMDIVDGMQRGFLAEVDYRMLTDGIDWEEVSRASRQGFTIKDLNQKLLVPERDLAMVKTICEKMAEMPDPRALAFCRSIEHAERLRPLFSAQGIRAALMHSRLPREQRFKNLSAFRMGEIDLLISIEMLNEGIDVPDVNLVAFMRVTHSRRIFLQQLGRGLRVNDKKDRVLVLDFVADIRRLAAGLSMNRDAEEKGSGIEIVRYRDGEIVKFDNDEPAEFFNKYLADVADVEDAEDGARLRFPGGEDF